MEKEEHSSLRGNNYYVREGLSTMKAERELSTITYAANTALTGNLTYGLSSYDDTIHEWTIEPASASSIRLIFSQFFMFSAEIIVEDSSGVLFSCASCGQGDVIPPVPPPFETTVGSVKVKAFGAEGVSFSASGFELQYVAIVGSADSDLNSVSLNYNMGYAHISPVLLTGGALQAGTTQEWYVNTASGAMSDSVIITLGTFNLPSDCITTLSIYDGTDADTRNVLFSGCQSSDKVDYWLYSHTNFIYVVLDNSGRSSDSSVDFTLTYRAEKDLFNCGALSIQLPDVLVAQSGFLIDGSLPGQHTNTTMRNNQNCEWLIQPAVAGTVTLIFHRVSLKYGSNVVVYDGSDTTGTVLWDSGQAHYYGGFQGGTEVVPPPLHSSSNALYVTYYSSSLYGGDSYGFYGEYYTNTALTTGIGNQDGEYLHMSTALDIALPGDKSSYPGFFNYSYNIRPDGIAAGSSIIFSLTDFSVSAPGDELVLYHGRTASEASILGSWNSATASSLPNTWYRTQGDEALLVFRSRGSSAGSGGFKMSYFTEGPNYHCGFQTNPITLKANSFTVSDGSGVTEMMYRNQSCKWIIDPPGTTGIYIFFKRFQVGGGSIKIYTGDSFEEDPSTLLFSIDEGVGTPAPFYVPYSMVGVSYQSDTSSVSGFGFSATYFRVAVDSSEPTIPGDNMIRLYSSSMLGLGNIASHGAISSTTNLTYMVSPNTTTGSSGIYFFVNKLNLTDCHGAITIHDGPDVSYPTLGTFCGDTSTVVPKWIYTSSPKATVTFMSDGTSNYAGNFDLSYYSDGPNSHCGFPQNPGILTSHSMVFTDGSATTEQIYDNQNCEWLISPSLDDGTGVLVLELLYSDLRGGALMEVYDGSDRGGGQLVWRCSNCNVVPKPIVLRSGTGFIRYLSSFATRAADDDGGVIGAGFKAVYWSVNSTARSQVFPDTTAINGSVLELPLGMTMASDTLNFTRHWYLEMGTWPQRLVFYPRLLSAVSSTDGGDDNNPSAEWLDGRMYSNTGDFQSLPGGGLGASACGTMYGNVTALLVQDDMTLAATQYTNAYVQSSSAGKNIHHIYGSWDRSDTTPSDAIYVPSTTCKYILDSGSSQLQSIDMTIKRLEGLGAGRLRIYTGLYGYDNLVFDSNSPVDAVRGNNLNVHINAPCGRATVLLDHNVTTSGTSIVEHGLELTYNKREADGDNCASTALVCPDCQAYIDSLIPTPPYVNPWLPYLYALYSCCLACFLFFCCLYLRKLSRKYYPDGGWISFLNPFKTIKIYKVVTPRHLKYTPRWDAWRNAWLLPTGECAICQEKTAVFKLSPCNHCMCVEDMVGYLGAALGDISQFPVKCPLHYEGCTSQIDAKTAKRVLDEPGFAKFNEFSDRVAYGEGMRCIFCKNYVNFPEEGGLNMVECPYCVQTFCIRCKKPWHFESKCPLEGIDDSLEHWKALSGAQKCPACKKLIEKSDVETCNHMIHKITDGIPCIRDRTDFCYCCGEEVLGDYPHEEVNHPGVNHFPDGVYQKCRTAMQRERDAERERLKRIKRMRNGGSSHRNRQQEFDAENSKTDGTEVDEDGWEVVPTHLMVSSPNAKGGLPSDDYFEAQWESELVPKPGDSPASSPSHADSNGPNTSPARKPKKRASPTLHSVPSRLPSLSPVTARIPTNHSGGRGSASQRPSPNRTPQRGAQSTRRVGPGGGSGS